MKKIFSFFLKDLKQSLILSIIAIFFVLYSVLIVRFFSLFLWSNTISIICDYLLNIFLSSYKERRKEKIII